MKKSKYKAINAINRIENQEDRNEEAIDFILRNCVRFKTAEKGVNFLIKNGCDVSRDAILTVTDEVFDEEYLDALQENHSYYQN